MPLCHQNDRLEIKVEGKAEGLVSVKMGRYTRERGEVAKKFTGVKYFLFYNASV